MPRGGLIDAHILTFILARDDGLTAAKIKRLVDRQDDQAWRMGEATMLRGLQIRHHPEPLPMLGKWLAERLKPQLAFWRSRTRRAAIQDQIADVAKEGDLAAIVDLFTNESLRQADEAGARQAAADVAAIDAELSSIERDGKVRYTVAEHMGATIAAALGLSALVMTAILAVSP